MEDKKKYLEFKLFFKNVNLDSNFGNTIMHFIVLYAAPTELKTKDREIELANLRKTKPLQSCKPFHPIQHSQFTI